MNTAFNVLVALAALTSVLDYFGLRPKKAKLEGLKSAPKIWKLVLMLILVFASWGMSGYAFYRSMRPKIIEKVKVIEKLVPQKCPVAAADTTQDLTDAQARQIVMRLGDLYNLHHSGDIGDKQRWINTELKKEGYTFQFTYKKHSQNPAADPCSLGRVNIDGFRTNGATNAVTTNGKVPCLAIKNLDVAGGQSAVVLNEKLPKSVPAAKNNDPALADSRAQ